MKKLVVGLVAAAWLSGAGFVLGQDEDLFDRLDANKDGFVTEDEAQDEAAKAKFRQAVRRGDKNGDGKLTKEELLAAIQPPRDEPRREGGDQPRPRREGPGPGGPRPDVQQLQAMFDKLDANEDGKLTEEEMPENARAMFRRLLETLDDDKDKAITREQAPRLLVFLMRPAGPPDGGVPGGRPDQRMVEEIFNRMDANKDGKLTADEVPADRRERFNQILGQLDTEDKAITKEQFARVGMQLMVPGGPPGFGGNPAMMMMPVLRVLDANSDGELSKEELENAGKALATLDKNEDGKLTRDELFAGAGGPFPGGGFPGRPGEGRPDRPRREGDRGEGDRREGRRPAAEGDEGKDKDRGEE